MILESLTLINFRQFKDKQKISFSPTASENVVVITGPNGAGKTNLLKSINWCVYDEVDDDREIINKAALSTAAKERRNVVARASLRFSHNGHNYICHRKITAMDIEEKKVETEEGTEIEYNYGSKDDFYLGETKATGETKEIKQPALKINTILPKRMRSHFFFDGEKIDTFTKSGHESKVKEGVKQVLQLNVLERAIRHLEELAGHYNSALKDLGGVEVKELAMKLEESKNRVNELKDELSKIGNEEDSAEHAIYELDKRLQQLEETKESVAERDDLEKENEYLESQIEETEEEIEDLSTRSYLLFGREICEKAGQIIEESRVKGAISSAYGEQLVKDLLALGKCICGREIEPGSPEEKELKSRIGGSEKKIQDLSMEMPTALAKIEASRGNVREKLLERRREKEDLVQELENNRRRLKEISGQIEEKGMEEGEDIGELERKRRDYEEDLDDLRREKWETNRDVEEEENRLSRLNSKLKNARTKKEKVSSTREKLFLADRSAQIAEGVYESFINGKRKDIQKMSEKIFDKLIWKDSQFRDVTITEDFELEVLDRWGTPARKDLSAGERECFSLAFIMAMGDSVGIEAPFILDTPFARISEVPLRNIASELPDLADQLVLLVTEKEFPEEERKEIAPQVIHEYKLDFDDTSGCTTIREET